MWCSPEWGGAWPAGADLVDGGDEETIFRSLICSDVWEGLRLVRSQNSNVPMSAPPTTLPITPPAITLASVLIEREGELDVEGWLGSVDSKVSVNDPECIDVGIDVNVGVGVGLDIDIDVGVDVEIVVEVDNVDRGVGAGSDVSDVNANVDNVDTGNEVESGEVEILLITLPMFWF